MSAFCVDVKPFPIICSVISLASLVVSIPIIVYGVYKSVSHRALKQIQAFLIIYYVNCVLWVVGMCGYNTFQLTLYSCQLSTYFGSTRLLTRMSGFFGYYYSLITVYLLYLLRLKYHLAGTKFELSYCAFYGLLSGALIQGISNAVASYYFFQDTNQWHIALMLSYASILTYAAYSIILLVLFFRNVQKVMIKTSSELLAKYTILAFFSFFTSILVNFMSFYRAFIGDPYSIYSLLLQLTLLQLDCLITVICLHLQFSYGYSHQFYNKCCCGCYRIYQQLKLSHMEHAEQTSKSITTNATSNDIGSTQMTHVTEEKEETEESILAAFTNTRIPSNTQ